MSKTDELRIAAEKHAQYLSGFFVSEDVPAVKAREIAATLRSLAAALAQQPAAPLSERDMLRLISSATTRANEFSDDGPSAQQPAASGEPVAWQVAGCFFSSYDAIPGGLLPPAAQPQPLYAAPQPAPAPAEPMTHREAVCIMAINSALSRIGNAGSIEGIAEPLKRAAAMFDAAQPAPARVPLTDAQREVLMFLWGAGPLGGLWWGEQPPDDERGRFWWRKHLTAAFPMLAAAPTAQQEPARAEGE